MRSQGWPACLLVVSCLTVTLSGCGDGGEFADLTEEDRKALGIPTVDKEPETNDEEIQQTGYSKVDPNAPEGNLKLSLSVGSRFPIKKTITQTLLQKGPTGPVTTESVLTMLFAIIVEAEENGRRLMTVRYQRVQYHHEILGEKVAYDSANPPNPIPSAALVYHGLVGNEFQFWLGADNQIAEVIDFDSFLQRCVQHVPAGRRHKMLKEIVATQEDEGFSNFVDNSIGLLPYDPKAKGRETAVKVGQSWDAPKQLMMRPLPMQFHTKYTLTDLTDEHAHVDVLGTITPAQSTTIGGRKSNEMITLKGGHTVGTCVIYRDTGLPMKSRVTRKIDMEVAIDARRKFDQHKTIVTTVEAFQTDHRAFSLDPKQPRVARPPGKPIVVGPRE